MLFPFLASLFVCFYQEFFQPEYSVSKLFIVGLQLSTYSCLDVMLVVVDLECLAHPSQGISLHVSSGLTDLG